MKKKKFGQAFRDKYLAACLLIIAVLFSMAASAQVDTTKVRQSIGAYGYSYKNISIDSSLRVPRDTFKLKQSDSGSLAFKSGRYWQWTGVYWDTLRAAIGGGPGGGGGGSTNLSFSRTANDVTVISDAGTDATLPAATTTQAGVMTATNRVKLDSAWTHRVKINDSVTVYYRSNGTEAYIDTLPAFLFNNAGAGVPLTYLSPGGNGVNIKRLQQGTNVTITQNADSSLTISAAGGGGSGLSGLTTNRVPYSSSATTIADDPGLTYSPSLNELTTDSIDAKTLRADTGIIVGSGRYDYDNSFWRPGIRFAEENKTGIARLAGITTFIDKGEKNVGIWREGTDVDVIYGYGANRLTVEATGSMNLVSLVGRMEFEGIGNGGWIDWVGYQAGSSLGRTIRITTDATSFGNSVVPIHFVPRNGFHAFRITDSVNNPYTHFTYRGWLGIGNDTAQRHIHVRNNGDVFERLESLSLTGNIGSEYFVQGNERWSNKLDVNSGQITENIGPGGYFKRWQINGTNAMGLDDDRTVFVNNRLFVGTTSSLGLGEKLAVNGTIGIADGSQLVETSGTSGVIISTAEGTSTFYGTGSTRGKAQVTPDFLYKYGSNERFRISTDGEVRINPAGPVDVGDFTLQNTGGIYQQGAFRLGGTPSATSPLYILAKQADSNVYSIPLPGGTTTFLRGNGTFGAAANLYSVDGTIPDATRNVTGNESNTLNFSSFQTITLSASNVNVSASSFTANGAVSLSSTQTLTSGTTATVSNNTYRVEFDPASALSTFTLTLPATPVDGQQLIIRTGRQIAAGSTTITSFTIVPNSGQQFFAAITPTTLVSGDYIQLEYEVSSTTWYRTR